MDPKNNKAADKALKQAQKKNAIGSGKSRRYQIGLISALTIIMVIIAVIAVNFLIDYLSDRYMLQLDMTNSDLYEITDETAQMLRTLDEPITCTVLCAEINYEENDTLYQVREVLRRYEILSEGKFTVQYIDANLNPALWDKYNALGDLSTGDLVIEGSKRYRRLSPSDLYEYQTDSSTGKKYLVGLKAEQNLTSAILYVIADKVPKAAYIQGHQEVTAMEKMDALLKTCNYELSTVSLITGEPIPEDVDLLIINQPKADYETNEIDAIEQFLDNDGSLLVFYASDTPALPRLDLFLESWGASFNNQIVMDSYQCLGGYPTYLLPGIASVEGLTDNLPAGYCLIPSARSINVTFSADDWKKTEVLMASSSKSYSKTLESAIESYAQADTDATGPFNLMVLTSEVSYDANLNTHASYVLFANASFVDDTTLGSDTFLNSKYFVALMSKINNDEGGVVIEPREYSSTALTISGWQANVLFYLLIIIIPLGTLALGVIVWLRRRHL